MFAPCCSIHRELIQGKHIHAKSTETAYDNILQLSHRVAQNVADGGNCYLRCLRKIQSSNKRKNIEFYDHSYEFFSAEIYIKGIDVSRLTNMCITSYQQIEVT